MVAGVGDGDVRPYPVVGKLLPGICVPPCFCVSVVGFARQTYPCKAGGEGAGAD